MALAYCEVCGDLVRAGSGRELPEGVICEGCFDSRRVMVPESSDIAAAPDPKQFECVYCHSLLRLRVPEGQRVEVRCPTCAETFFLTPEGRPQARLEGNTTQIMDMGPAPTGELMPAISDTTQAFVAPDLTPPSGRKPTGSFTKSFKIPGAPLPKGTEAEDQVAPHQKTQPMQAPTFSGPFASRDHDERSTPFSESLAGDLDIVDDSGPLVSPEQQRAPRNDQRATRRSSSEKASSKKRKLRASDADKIDLGLGELKAKTSRYQKRTGFEEPKIPSAGRVASKASSSKSSSSKASAAEPRKAKKKGTGKVKRGTGPAARPKPRSARQKKRKPALTESEQDRKLERGAKAAAAAKAMGAERDRRALGAGLSWVAWALPTLLALFLLNLASRGATLANPERGAVGRTLKALGDRGDSGVRSLNALLPEGTRSPDLQEERLGK